MRNQLRALYESEGDRRGGGGEKWGLEDGRAVESMNTDGERAQVTLLWDERHRPRCGACAKPMRINRKTRQGALDWPLGPASFVLGGLGGGAGLLPALRELPDGASAPDRPGSTRRPCG